jgi:DNA-binding NtrC family response regulator
VKEASRVRPPGPPTSRATDILLVDDDETFRMTLADQLRRRFPSVREADTTARCMEALAEAEPDVILLDLHLSDGDGLELLGRLRERAPSTEVIVVTGFGTVDAAVEAMRRGAFDFVTKPLRLEALVQVVERAGERRALRRENEGLRRMLDRKAPPLLVGESEALREVRELCARAALSDAPVLITGPSGAGKELVARSIHAASARAGRELITVNSAAFAENLLESELFGHERGAFTGATEQQQGLLEAAHQGTLFLDEVGELPAAIQAKLLRALQFGEIRRVGGVATLKVDVRFLAATNRDLAAAVKERTFREDLYYRLNVITIHVPPLAERPEDVEPIFRHLAKGLPYAFFDEHFAVLRSYGWPGNVREMENLVERLKIRASDGPPDPQRLLSLLGQAGGAPAVPLVRPLDVVEKETIEHALRVFGGDRKAAADALGISLRTLYYRLSTYKEE